MFSVGKCFYRLIAIIPFPTFAKWRSLLLLSFAHRTRKIMSFYTASISSLVLHPFVVGKFCFSRH